MTPVPDEELLTVCRHGGLAGGTAQRRALLLYRRSVREWRARDEAWRREHAAPVVGEALYETVDRLTRGGVLRNGLRAA